MLSKTAISYIQTHWRVFNVCNFSYLLFPLDFFSFNFYLIYHLQDQNVYMMTIVRIAGIAIVTQQDGQRKQTLLGDVLCLLSSLLWVFLFYFKFFTSTFFCEFLFIFFCFQAFPFPLFIYLLFCCFIFNLTSHAIYCMVLNYWANKGRVFSVPDLFGMPQILTKQCTSKFIKMIFFFLVYCI